jgi:predicted nucleotidyltransferase
LQSQVYAEIDHVANRIKEVEGVVGVVLFGSYARGDYDEGSDVDLLVVFKNKAELDRGVKILYKITAESDLFFQVIGLTLDELKASPLLESALRDGKIYSANEDLRQLLALIHKPYALVTYSAANLSPKERVICTQKLEGRGKGKHRYNGLIHALGGYKIGRGVVMIPLENPHGIFRNEESRLRHKIRLGLKYLRNTFSLTTRTGFEQRAV